MNSRRSRSLDCRDIRNRKRSSRCQTQRSSEWTRWRRSTKVSSSGHERLSASPRGECSSSTCPRASATTRTIITVRARGDPGQEEVYIPLTGWATLHLNGEEQRLEPGTWARVGIEQLRQIVPGPEGFQYIAIGGAPGAAFVPPAWTELGAAPPSMPE